MPATDAPAPATRAQEPPRQGAPYPAPPRVPRRIWATAVALGVAAAVLAFLFAPHQGSGPIETEGDEELQRAAATYLDGVESRAQGLVVLHRDAQGTTAGLTGGTVDGEAAPDSETPFETGSVWKVLTAMLLADLAEEDVTSPERTLGEIYPDTAFADAAVAEVSLEELATHSSGLARIAEDAQAAAMASELFTLADPYRASPDPAESLASARLHTPGEYAYSNFGYAVLGQALEREAGTPYPELLRARLLEPLGMADTLILGAEAEAPPSGAALPHVEAGARSQVWNAPHYAPAGIGTWSTAEDLMRLLEAVQEETAPGMDALDIAYDAPEDAQMGLGWMRTPLGEGEMTWHSGATFGSAAFIGFGGGEAVVALSNSFQIEPTGLGAAVLGAEEAGTAAQAPTAPPTALLVGLTLALTVPPAVLALSLVMGRKTLVTRRPLDRLRLVSMPLGAAAVLLAAQHSGSWSLTPPVLWAAAVGAVVASLVAGVWLWPRTAVLRARVRALRLLCFGLSATVSALLGATAIHSLIIAHL